MVSVVMKGNSVWDSWSGRGGGVRSIEGVDVVARAVANGCAESTAASCPPYAPVFFGGALFPLSRHVDCSAFSGALTN